MKEKDVLNNEEMNLENQEEINMECSRRKY